MSRKFHEGAVRTGGSTEALDQPIANIDDITLPASGSIDGIRDTVIEPVTDLHGFHEKAAALAFNEEILDVIIAESTDQNPEHFVFLAINGRGAMKGGNPWVPRGTMVSIARKYVERLCRAKPVSIRTVEAVDSDGAKTMRIQRSAALKYPFTVVRDPNPRGVQWLRDLLAQPQ